MGEFLHVANMTSIMKETFVRIRLGLGLERSIHFSPRNWRLDERRFGYLPSTH